MGRIIRKIQPCVNKAGEPRFKIVWAHKRRSYYANQTELENLAAVILIVLKEIKYGRATS